VIFRLSGQSPPAVDPIEARILQAIGDASGLSTRQVAEFVELSPRSARTRLKSLVDRGLIVEVGSSPTDPKRLYYLRSGEHR
jgi:DNA-binding Lrp family transcriptional regulator